MRTAAPAVTETDNKDKYGGPPISFGSQGAKKKQRELTQTEIAGADGLSLIVHWADSDGPARGQIHITGLRPQGPPIDTTIPPVTPAPSSAAPTTIAKSLASQQLQYDSLYTSCG